MKEVEIRWKHSNLIYFSFLVFEKDELNEGGVRAGSDLWGGNIVLLKYLIDLVHEPCSFEVLIN